MTSHTHRLGDLIDLIGSGGMFVQSEKFAESHGGQLGDFGIPLNLLAA